MVCILAAGAAVAVVGTASVVAAALIANRIFCICDRPYKRGCIVMKKFKSKPKMLANGDLEKNMKEAAELHRDAKMELECAARDMEKSIFDTQKASDDLLKELRCENEKAITELQMKIDEGQKQYDDEIAKRIKKHEDNMQMLLGENKEERKAAELRYRMEMDKLKKEHDAQIKEAEEMICQIKEEGSKKIEEVERLKDELIKQRGEELEQFGKEMKEMLEYFMQQSNEIKQQILQLRMTAIKESKMHMEEDYQLQMKQICDLADDIKNHNAQSATKRVLEAFLQVLSPVVATMSLLNDIQPYCFADGGLCDDICFKTKLKTVQELRSAFVFNVNRFFQLLITEKNASPEVLSVCNAYIQKLEHLITGDQLRKLCVRLPAAIARNDSAEIEDYENCISKLSDNFALIRSDMRGSIEQVKFAEIRRRPAVQALE